MDQARRKFRQGKTRRDRVFPESKFELGHGYANLVARRCLEAASGEEPKGAEDLVEAQYSGTKVALKPFYDLVIAAAKSCGKDVEIDPKKAT